MSLMLLATSAGSLQEILISFLVLVVILAVIGGLIWCVEKWVHPLPGPVKLVIAIVLVILVIIWGIRIFAPGG